MSENTEFFKVVMNMCLKHLKTMQVLYCDEGIHKGQYKIRFDTLYVSPEELAELEAFLK